MTRSAAFVLDAVIITVLLAPGIGMLVTSDRETVACDGFSELDSVADLPSLPVDIRDLLHDIEFEQEDGTCEVYDRDVIETSLWWILGGLLVSLGVLVATEARGGSPGKKLTGLALVDDETGQPIGYVRSGARQLVRIVSGLVLLAGFLWATVDRKGRTWHDCAVGAVTVAQSRTEVLL